MIIRSPHYPVRVFVGQINLFMRARAVPVAASVACHRISPAPRAWQT